MSLFSDLFTVTVHVKPPDEELMRLNREATAAKESGDWNLAIFCLRQAREQMLLMGDLPGSLRLPLFLQQAGKFDKAMREFEWLLLGVRSYVRCAFDHASANVRRSVEASHRARIYDKMRLACQREKRPKDAAVWADLREKNRKIKRMLDPLIQAERKKKREEK